MFSFGSPDIFRCLFGVPRRGRLRGGRVMKTTKTRKKVCSSYGTYIEVLYHVIRRYGSRHLGSGPAQLTISQCHSESGVECSASRASILSSPSWLGHNRALLRTPFKGSTCPCCLLWVIWPLTHEIRIGMDNIRVVDDMIHETE